MHFGDAWTLWFLVPLWALYAALWLTLALLDARARLPRSAALAYSSVALARTRPSWAPRARRLVQASRLITLALLIVALARPQSVRALTPATSSGIDIVLAIDTSGTMRALDLDGDKRIQARRTRLGVVQDVVADFVEKRPGDELGMVVFGAEAFMQCPLTLDHSIVKTLLSRLEVGMAGDATAIGSGIAAAVNRLKKSKAKSKVIVLLTDGLNNAGPLAPKKAAEAAQAFGIRIYTIGAGTRGKAPFLIDRPFFGQTVQYDDVSIDEDALREVASVTGGAYFRAVDAKGLGEVYAQIDELEKSDLESRALVEYDEREASVVLPAIILLLLEVVLLGTRLVKIP